MMEATKKMVLSNKRAEILAEYEDFLVVHWSLHLKEEYRIYTPIEYSNGRKSCVSRIALNYDMITEYMSNSSKMQEVLDDLRKMGREPYMDSKVVEDILKSEDLVLISQSEKYFIAKSKECHKEQYTLVADPKGRSGMANNYPWDYTISREQAMIFAQDEISANAFFKSVY